MIKTIHPADEQHWLSLRKQDVTSTETAALFGLSPYMTQFELWHRKHDNLEVEFKMNDRVVWGKRLEATIADGIAMDRGWPIAQMTEYIRDTDLRMGASFDFKILDGRLHVNPREDEILEIKNVDSLAFRDGWIVDGDNVEAPPHIEIQVQQQLALTGFKNAWIGALIGGNRVVLIKREPDPVVIESIKNRIREFWESVGSNNPPKPDFAKDADFIASLYSHADPGTVFNADERVSKLAFAYKQAGAEEKTAKEKKDAAKAEILTIIGSAEKVVGPWGSISAGLVGPTRVEYDREGFRKFRVNIKKEK